MLHETRVKIAELTKRVPYMGKVLDNIVNQPSDFLEY